jgi:DNA polymerase I-like protein with 3'-5' exonuclease and polymerase domains
LLVFDTESDGLLDEATKLHVINIIDRETGAREAYHDRVEFASPNLAGTLIEGVDRLHKAIVDGRPLAGHNIIRHDLPLIKKLYPDFNWHPDDTLDTLVASRLIWTDLKDIDLRAIKRRKRPEGFSGMIGKHSLGAWGYRLGEYKGDFKGPWDKFTAEMQDYGIQDVEVTLKLVEKIEAENYSMEAILLEQRVAEIIFLQERHGFWFDIDAAHRLEVQLMAEQARLEDELRSAFSPWFAADKTKGSARFTPKKRRRATVALESGEKWLSEYDPEAPYSKVKLVSFEPGSRDKIADRLIKLMGWTPVEFTPTGKPKVDETTLGGLDYPEAKLLIEYLTVDKRLGQLATGDEAWLKKVKPDRRIHGRVNTNGAITGRMTHSGPNVAQVPKVGSPYGEECRALFTAAPGKLLVGTDAEGLELRELAHYMARYDGGAYAEAVVNGDKKLGTDAHSLNMKALGLKTRDAAKTWLYAYIYGAGNLKLGKIQYDDMGEAWRTAFNHKHKAGKSRENALARLGKTARGKIETGIPALGKVREAVAKAGDKLRSHDGRLLNVRSDHSKFNTLLQGGGAVVMKKALVLAYDALLDRGWVFGREFAMVANIHDEIQTEVDPDIAEEVGRITADAIRRAGEAFQLRCPLAGSSDIGPNWASTH